MARVEGAPDASVQHAVPAVEHDPVDGVDDDAPTAQRPGSPACPPRPSTAARAAATAWGAATVGVVGTAIPAAKSDVTPVTADRPRCTSTCTPTTGRPSYSCA